MNLRPFISALGLLFLLEPSTTGNALRASGGQEDSESSPLTLSAPSRLSSTPLDLLYDVPSGPRIRRQGSSTCQMVNFEGNGDLNPVRTLGSPITATFNGSWQSLVDADANGSGNFANEPSPSTILVFTNAAGNSIDFSEPVQSVSIAYSAGASSLPVALSAWSGSQGTGNPVASDSGSVLGDRAGGANCQGDPNGQLCAWGSLTAAAPGNFIRSITFPGAGADSVGFDNLEFCTSSATGECTPNDSTLCLNGGRFEVRARWQVRSGDSGQASAVPLTPDTGYFWFFDRDNVEAVIKILDACAINQNFWAFAAGLTDVEVTITVTDTETGLVRVYENSLGTPFAPIQDTNAFDTCP
ncbi:MAG: hypothetical protein AAF690_16320 [Acidobacteriota bacterium]